MSRSTCPRCAVIGVGRMGRHHARIYSELSNVEFLGVIDENSERAQDIVERHGGRAFASIEELIEAEVDAVTIATPTTRHRRDAEQLLESGIACLIEKPLAPDVAEAEAIQIAAERSGAVLQVGHVVRYDPVMMAVRRIPGITPRFIEMMRISPLTFRSLDVGVVLDMMIHDLDLLLMLVGEEPEEVTANAVSVVGDSEDICNARLTFPADESGYRCVANVTASRLALKTERKLRIISETAYVSADFVDRKGTIVERTANEEQLNEIREQIRSGADLSDVNYLDVVNISPLEVGEEEPLRIQAEDFLDAVRTGRRPEVDAQAGAAAVRTAERIVEAAGAAGARMV